MFGLSTFSDAELAGVRKQVTQHSGWFIALGVLIALVGVAAIALPIASGVAAAIWVGWSLLISGLLMLLQAIFAWRWPNSIWSILTSILYIGTGVTMLTAPISGAISLTIVLAAVFVAEGVIEMVQAFRLRGLPGWGWMLFSGLTAVAAGALIAYQFPSSAIWAVGLVFGLNLLSTGVSCVMFALACRDGATQLFGHSQVRS